ncbi:MAG: c-type cytochrome [Thiohalorhabdus sp.]
MRHNHAPVILLLVLTAILPATALAEGGGGLSGETVYETRCLLCHPDSPDAEDASRYKARKDAVPLWTLYRESEGWQESQIGLGSWSDERMKEFIRYPKGMKPDTTMVGVPLNDAELKEVVAYIKELGRRHNSD